MSTRRHLEALVLLSLFLVGVVWAQTSSAYDNRWHVLSGGGSQGMTASSHTIHGTLGQFAIGHSTDSQNAIGSGYWYGYWQSESGASPVIYLPLTLRAYAP